MTGSMMIVTLLAGPLLVVLVAASACIIIVIITSTVAINIMERNHHHAHVSGNLVNLVLEAVEAVASPWRQSPRTKAKKPSAC